MDDIWDHELKLDDPSQSSDKISSAELDDVRVSESMINNSPTELLNENERLKRSLKEKEKEIRRMEKKISNEKTVQDVLRHNGESTIASDIAATKIISLSKQIRTLECQLTRLKTDNIELKNQINNISSGQRQPNNQEMKDKLDDLMKELSDFKTRMKEKTTKIAELKLQNETLKQECIKWKKIIEREIGVKEMKVVDLLRADSNWRGRQQQIILLQNKCNEYEVKLNSLYSQITDNSDRTASSFWKGTPLSAPITLGQHRDNSLPNNMSSSQSDDRTMNDQSAMDVQYEEIGSLPNSGLSSETSSARQSRINLPTLSLNRMSKISSTTTNRLGQSMMIGNSPQNLNNQNNNSYVSSACSPQQQQQLHHHQKHVEYIKRMEKEKKEQINKALEERQQLLEENKKLQQRIDKMRVQLKTVNTKNEKIRSDMEKMIEKDRRDNEFIESLLGRNKLLQENLQEQTKSVMEGEDLLKMKNEQEMAWKMREENIRQQYEKILKDKQTEIDSLRSKVDSDSLNGSARSRKNSQRLSRSGDEDDDDIPIPNIIRRFDQTQIKKTLSMDINYARPKTAVDQLHIKQNFQRSPSNGINANNIINQLELYKLQRENETLKSEKQALEGFITLKSKRNDELYERLNDDEQMELCLHLQKRVTELENKLEKKTERKTSGKKREGTNDSLTFTSDDLTDNIYKNEMEKYKNECRELQLHRNEDHQHFSVIISNLKRIYLKSIHELKTRYGGK
ncbi:hypothetical protein SNEBB_001655 [Seison nebaliae]|nr:hypothetical protein SNEBB_001655 [Seison nebaliae]